MTVSSDQDYLNTKLVKQGLKGLNPVFQELADWINFTFQTKVLNICYEKIKVSANQPRLTIIFEFNHEAKKFNTPTGFTDEQKEEIIIQKFISIVNNNTSTLQKFFRLSKFDTKRIFVIFEAFEAIARQEANRKIPQAEIEVLKDQFKIKGIWEVFREFELTTFFFQTNSQIEEGTRDGTTEAITSSYYRLLKMYDTFDYIKPADSFVAFDSKENFDGIYESSWFYYSKR